MWPDAEYRRLLYVAMTRACDELYICGYRGKREQMEDCWYNMALSALQPAMLALEDGKGWRLGASPVMVETPAADAARCPGLRLAFMDRARTGAGRPPARANATAAAPQQGAGGARHPHSSHPAAPA